MNSRVSTSALRGFFYGLVNQSIIGHGGFLCNFFGVLFFDDGFLRFGTTAILSGAVANLIDRVQTGYVVDFFDFRIWPVFNVADIAIVAGMGLMIYSILFRHEEMSEIEGVRQ